jgi:hypothetical protein
VTFVLLVFFALAAASFVLGLYALGAQQDMLAILLCGFGALSLRALRQAGRAADGGSR